MMLRRKMALTPLFIVKGFVAGIAYVPKQLAKKGKQKKKKMVKSKNMGK